MTDAPKQRHGVACPACNSSDVVEFLYGLPSPEGRAMLERGERVMGGCMVSSEAPVWRCRACRQEFGRLGDEWPGLFNAQRK